MKYKAYFLVHDRLSSIQKGIQAVHAMSELFVKYTDGVQGNEHLIEWAEKDKTVILLNGGNSSNLKFLYEQISDTCYDLNIPFAKFYEDRESLNGALTCVAVIVPESIYSIPVEHIEEDTIQSDQRLKKLLSGLRRAF